MNRAEDEPVESAAAGPARFLRRYDLLLGRFFEVSLDMLCVASLDGYFRTLNPAWTAILGYSEHELLSRPYVEFVHPEDRGITGEETLALNQGSAVMSFENRYIAMDGSHHWLAWNAMPDVDEGLIYAIARDVSTQVHRQQVGAVRNEITTMLSRASDWEAAVAAAMGSVLEQMRWTRAELWVPDGEGLRLEEVVRGTLPETPWRVTRESALGGAALRTRAPVVLDDILDHPGFWATEPARQGEARGALAFPILRQDQVIGVLAFFTPNSRPLEALVVPSLAGVGIHLGDHRQRLDAEEVSRLSERLARASLEFRATHDPLTGLPNRELALDRLDRAVATSRRVGRRLVVMMLDLNNFKAVNDAHGHAAGDDVLRESAARLTATLRDADTVARLGGDEFSVVAMEGEAPGHEGELAARVMAAFDEPFVAVPGLVVRPSIGLVLYPDHAEGAAELLAAADAAMYAAKVRGGGWAVYEASMPPGRAGSV